MRTIFSAGERFSSSDFGAFGVHAKSEKTQAHITKITLILGNLIALAMRRDITQLRGLNVEINWEFRLSFFSLMRYIDPLILTIEAP